VGSRGAFAGQGLPIQSPTAANGFVIFDSDYLDNGGTSVFGSGTSPAPHVGALITPVLNLSSMSAPILKFNQFHRRFAPAAGYNSATFIITSLDGGQTWPDTIPINTLFELGANIQTLRNSQIALNLPNIGGQANVRIQFLFSGDYYFWMIDDIILESASANDLALIDASIFNSNAGSVQTYGMIPVFQEQSASFHATILNQGAAQINQPGVAVNVLRNGNNIWTDGVTSPGTLTFGASQQLSITNPPFVGGQAGEYQVNFSLFNNQGDLNPGNDVLSRYFFLTDTVYGLDHGPFSNYVTVGTNSFVANGSQSMMRFANRYVVTGAGMRVTSAFLGLAQNSLPGALINFQLYSASDLSVPLEMTADIALTAQHIAAGGLTLAFPGSGYFLSAGEYYLVAEVSGAGTNVVNVLDDISRPRANDASIIYLSVPDSWFSNGIAFALRMHGNSPSSSGMFTDAVRSRGFSSAVVVGSHDAGANFASKGVVYSQNPSPTLANLAVVDSSTGNSIYAAISNLLPAMQYYARTFVTDNAGQTSFGNEILFRTFDTLGTHPARITFDITAPATAAGSYGYGLGAGVNSLWNYEIDTIAVQAPLVVGRAAQSDSLGCDGTLMNAAEMKGKIVVLYRGTCEFGLKALSAQQAGAVGVIIVNNQPGLLNMSGGMNGANVTIPVVMISAFDGTNLRPMIDNGLVKAFIGNKFGRNNLDLVIGSGDVIKPLAFALPLNLVSQPGDYVVDLGAQVQNIGIFSTSFDLNVQVWRNGSSQDVVYFQNVIGANIGLGQSHVAVTAPFDLSSLGIGNHRIRYEVLPTIGSDQAPADNVYFQDLRITQELYATTSLNASGDLNIPGNANRPSVPGPYTVGNWFKAPQAGRMKVSELKFSFTATAPTVLTNQFIEGAVYRWDDLDSNGNVDLNEMIQVGTGDYLYPDNGISQERSMLMFDYITNQPGVTLTNGARYLFAVTYTGSDFDVYANTDPLSNYTATNNYTGEPTTAVFSSNGFWSTNGFGSQTVFTIAAVMVPQSGACQSNLVAQGNTNLCLDQFVGLTVNSGDPIDFVEWYVNGRFIPQVNGTNLDARSDGEYTAIVHFVSGCIDTTNSINVVVAMPHQANVSVNGPLHYQAGQAINTIFSAVPQQLLTLNLQGSPVRQLSYRNVLASSGWINVPQGAAANFNGDVVIARDGSVGDSLACGPITGTSLQGKVAMVFRGVCAISDKALNAQRAGAIAVIVVNNGINQFIPTFSANPLTGDSVTIPVLIVSNEAGMELAELIGSTSGVSLAFAPAASSAYTYSWLLNDMPISGANGNNYTATATGDYQLYVETAGGNCAYLSGYWPVSQSNFTQSPWTLQNLNQPIANQTIRNIEPVSSSTAWALGDKSTNTGLLQNFYRTTDGGNSWNAGSIPNTTALGTSHIMAFDEQTAFVTLFGDSASQGLYKTVDGGNSWNRLNVFNNGGFPNFSHFWNQNEGVLVGDPNQLTGAWEIYRTTNGGNTWQMVTNIPMPFAFDEYGTTATMSVAPNGNMYWPTVGGRLFVTNNQGLSWTTRMLPAGGGQYYIAFTDNGQGAAYHAPSAKLYVTNDDGFSWIQLARPYGGLANILSMSYVPNANNLILMVSGPLGTAYLENNFNWSNIDGEYHSAVKFIEPSVGWSGGLSANNGQGGVWKWNSQVFGGNQPTGTVGGQVRYANNAQTPMSNTYVIAYDALDHTIRDAVQTDANGNYLFTNAPVGNYILRASTTKPWGGVNATDALRIARHFTSLQPLTGLRLQAADVNANNVINSTDALQVAQRFTGLLNNPNYLRVYFDALLGGNLAQTTSVHMHSGASIDPDFGWQYVVGDWGNPASPGQMTSLGNGKWSFAMNPVAYYNQAPNGPMPAGSSIDNIGMVFRESGPCGSGVPCLEQKDGFGEDIYIYPWLNPPASSYLGVKAAMSTPTGFAAGDWIFNEASVQVLEGQLTTVNLQGICVGDVDGSYNPGNVRLAPMVALVNDGDLLATSNKIVKLPIRIENGAHLGAMSLKLHYNAAQLQPVALKLMNAELEHQAQVNIVDGVISFGWFDLGGWIVANDQVILELEAYVLVNGINQFDIWVGEGSEFADQGAQPLNNAKLLMPGLRSQNIPTSNALSLNNYPNPFRHETTIAFELPEAGRVKMIVTDVTGRAITELELGDRSAGKHEHSFEGAALSAGVYFCELQVQGATRQEKAIIRMIIK
jgi:photosystem II stability/assembly factor-like uncharacterized protein